MSNVVHRLGFDIVHGCQLRCIGCPNSTLKPKIKTISVDDFSDCLQNIDVELVGHIRLFNFGEPLLHPNLPEILSKIPEQSWKYNHVEISTNAQHFDEDMLREIYKSKIVTVMAVSCDGNGTPEDYERLRPPAKWDKLMYFLTEVKKMRDEYCPNMQLRTRVICNNSEGKHR